MPFAYKQLSSLLSSGSGSGILKTLIGFTSLQDILENGTANLSFDSLASLLNVVLVFGLDPATGISVFPDHLATVQTHINALKDKAMAALKEKFGEDSGAWMMIGSIIPNFFPAALTDVRFATSLKEDGTFSSASLTFKDTRDVTSSGVTTAVTYDFLKIDIAIKAMEENYFSTLESDASKVQAGIGMKAKIASDIKASALIVDKSEISSSSNLSKIYSIYDAIHFQSGFTKDLTAYRDYVASLDDEASDNYVSNMNLKNAASFKDYLPYAGFSVSKSDDSSLQALPDLYVASVGSSYVLNSFKAVGDSKAADPLASASITFKMTDAKNIDISADIATYDSLTNTISILSAPAADMQLVITSTSGSYSKLTYRLTLKAA